MVGVMAMKTILRPGTIVWQLVEFLIYVSFPVTLVIALDLIEATISMETWENVVHSHTQDVVVMLIDS